MNLREISVSIYSFGYSAGFIRDDRPEAIAPMITLETIADLAAKYGLGGIEFPVDRYYKAGELDRADSFISEVCRRGMRASVDLENFDVSYLRALLPILSRNQLRFVRIKMSSFYGGNRYREPGFENQRSTLIKTLRLLLPELRDRGVKLLIENHQDLGASDLIQIIGATSADCVGVNWDIGNSWAVLDTPETFLKKAGGCIGNIHLKDYKLFRCEKGFFLSRCALGEGVADFASLLSELRRLQGPVPMTIELGAQNTRRADVFDPAYWEAYGPSLAKEAIEFFSVLNTHLLDGEDWKTPWERNLPGKVIVESEMKEFEQSVAFLGGLGT